MIFSLKPNESTALFFKLCNFELSKAKIVLLNTFSRNFITCSKTYAKELQVPTELLCKKNEFEK